MKAKANENTSGFIQGGGEMGELVRNHDWENTPLGKPENWPLSLRTTLGIVLHSAFPMFLFWGKDLLCFYNDAYRPSLGIDGKHPLVGKKAQDAWPDIWDFIGPLIEKVMSTGEAVWFEDQLLPIYRNGHMEDVYWTFSYGPAYGDHGQVEGVFVTCTETTAKVKALHELNESKGQLEFAIDAARLGTWELNPVTNKFRGNDRLKEWFGLKPEEEIELSLAINVMAEKDRPQVMAAITKALTWESGGRYEIDYTIENPVTGKKIIVRAKGRAFFNEQKQPYTFSGTLEDITAEAAAKKELEESELFSHNVFYNSPVAKLVFTGLEMKIARINENMLELLGRDQSIIGKTFEEALPELLPTDLPAMLKRVYTTGDTIEDPEKQIGLKRFGKAYSGYYNYTYKAVVSTLGEIYGVMITASEVTEQVQARRVREAREKELRDLITAAPIGICVLNGIEARIEEVNERFIIISGKKPEQFVNATYWEVFPEVAEPFAPILENVFKTGIKFSSEETEMVLIRSGVPEKIFATFDYVPVVDKDNLVTKVIVLVIEVTHQVETRREIEAAVVKRTKELAETNLNLKRSNAELEQFAYIASHDLQEPIRKIGTFTEMLQNSLGDISDTSKAYISKIYNSTNRMSKLIRDVLAFSQVSQSTGVFEQVDLTKTIQGLETDFELLIEETKAEIALENLPVIEAVPSQMTQLFGNLISNSLKYRKPGVAPRIKISATEAEREVVEKHPQLMVNRKYFHIVFSDNGIGFDQEHADRIFMIFQRLHGKNEFEGTGIGLSISRKIVQSHHGHISAQAGKHGGASFHILLPGF